jgi:hypothetical protein
VNQVLSAIDNMLNNSGVAEFAKNLQSLENSVKYYVPRKEHPFYESISQAKIPMKNKGGKQRF